MNIEANRTRLGTRNNRSAYNPVPAPHDTGVRNGSHGYDVFVDGGTRTSTNTFLQNIGPEHLIRLRQFLKRVNLAKDQYLYQQDDKIDNIFFPETAVVSEFQILEDGRMIEVGIVGGEGVVGVASAFNACRAANCTQVCVAGTALVIGRDIFEREVSSDPRLQSIVHNYINNQIKQLSQRVVCNTFHSVEQRFCSWLLTLQGRSRRDRFRITHEHVARVLGVHRPSVTCIAQGLREKNLIDYGRARLVISDKSGIERLACGCSGEAQTARTIH
jgi:CRP-like cAMP-binding protein